MKKEMQLELKKIDSLERVSLNFKYYEYLSYYSKELLTIGLEQYGSYFDIQEIKNIKKSDLSKITKKQNIDFAVLFENIETVENKNSFKMCFNLYLYSGKTNKVILEKKICGNMDNNDNSYSFCKNPLFCLFTNSSKNALNILGPEIINRITDNNNK